MGLLSDGTPLSWSETKEMSNHVHEHGIDQFINQYVNLKNRTGDCLKWGDEIEYIIVKFNHEKKTAKVSLKGSKLLENLTLAEKSKSKAIKSLWRPEYAEYMIEGTPGSPYGSLVQHFNIVEHNMKFRREEIENLLSDDEIALSITNFFRLGCPNFTEPSYEPNPTKSCSKSLFFPDEAIAQCHPRFKTLTQNIRLRRGEKVAINIPIFRDEATANPFKEDLIALGDDGSSTRAAKPDHVYLDAMGFGMGCCCLQITFQTRTVDEARVLYDHLTPVCPIMLALTAASPIFRGYLTDVDCRWDIISASVDCRTREERGLKPLENDKFKIPKSRYSSVDMYISEHGEKYNDLDVPYDTQMYDKLKNNGIDSLLAKHISHLFIRNSIALFSEKIHQDDKKEMDHFENIQSTNWQTMRFKVPPVDSDIGWRVEFRPCEVQFTDFENAAFAVFVTLLTRAILTFKLNMLMPISKVDENMIRSQKRNAIMTEKFWFRKDIFEQDKNVTKCEQDQNRPIELEQSKPKHKEDETESNLKCEPNQNASKVEDHQNGPKLHGKNRSKLENEKRPKTEVKEKSSCDKKKDNSCDIFIELTIDEIFNGKGDEFVGLIPLVTQYVTSLDCDADTACSVHQYLKLIRLRAQGKAMTNAGWMRNFVTSHPSYKRDSVVTEEISYDMLVQISKITRGAIQCPELFGITPNSKTSQDVPNSVLKSVKKCSHC